jgi:hypothetical protein
MTEPPDTLVAGGVGFLRDASCPTHFFYYPAEPSLAQHPDGTPQLSWLNEASRLLMTTQWSLRPDAQDILSGIAKLTNGQISFTPATALVSKVSIELGNGQGDYQPIASTQQSAGYAPHQTIFNVKLDAEQTKIVDAALADGRPIPLRITYHANLQLIRVDEVSCSVVGDVSGDVRALRGKFIIMDDDCRTRLTDALAARRLSMECSSTPNAPEELREEARQKAIDGAATKLRELAERLSEADEQEPIDKVVFEAEPGNIFRCQASRITTVPMVVSGVAGT